MWFSAQWGWDQDSLQSKPRLHGACLCMGHCHAGTCLVPLNKNCNATSHKCIIYTPSHASNFLVIIRGWPTCMGEGQVSTNFLPYILYSYQLLKINTRQEYLNSSSDIVYRFLLWKWLRLAHRKSTPMSLCIHSPTVHCNMALFFFDKSPVLLLQTDRKSMERN